MERDMDLIRRIALETSAIPYGNVLIGLEDVSEANFAVHAIWMQEAGLIKASIQEFLDNSMPKVSISRLTWEGCEFVDAVKNDTVWAKAKKEIIAPTMSFTFSALKDWLKAEIVNGFPTLIR